MKIFIFNRTRERNMLHEKTIKYAAAEARNPNIFHQNPIFAFGANFYDSVECW